MDSNNQDFPPTADLGACGICGQSVALKQIRLWKLQRRDARYYSTKTPTKSAAGLFSVASSGYTP